MTHINQAPQKTFILDYPVASIKHAINETTRLAPYMLRGKNELLNTYKIAIVIGFNSGIMDVVLTVVDENKTSCSFQTFNTVGGISASASLSGLQDKFLHTFSKILTGKIKVVNKSQAQNEEQSKNKKPASFQTWFIIIFLILLALVIIVAKNK